MIERSADAICDLYRAQGDEEYKFLGLASKPRLMVSPDLALKPVASCFPVWAQIRQLRVDDLGLKITATVSWFVPQNHVGYDLSVAS
jgi:hypothetical protein